METSERLSHNESNIHDAGMAPRLKGSDPFPEMGR
jgi:hypothetical protein